MSSDTAFGVLERLSAVADELSSLDLGGLDDAEFLAWIVEVERLRRRLQTVDQPIVAEVEVRDLSEKHLARRPSVFLSQVWRIDGAEAGRRVAEVQALSRRVALSGEPLEPIRPLVAEARRRGEVGSEQVRTICRTLNDIPDRVPVEEVSVFEQILVEAATQWATPKELHRLGDQVLAGVNPDGELPSEEEQDRRRYLNPPRPGTGWSTSAAAWMPRPARKPSPYSAPWPRPDPPTPPVAMSGR